MVSIILLVALYSAFVVLTFLDRHQDRLFLPRLALLLGLIVLALITVAEKLAIT